MRIDAVNAIVRERFKAGLEIVPVQLIPDHWCIGVVKRGLLDVWDLSDVSRRPSGITTVNSLVHAN